MGRLLLSPGANQSLGGRAMGKTKRNPMTWQKLLNRFFKGASLGPFAIYHPPPTHPKKRNMWTGIRDFSIDSQLSIRATEPKGSAWGERQFLGIKYRHRHLIAVVTRNSRIPSLCSEQCAFKETSCLPPQ